MISHRPGRKLYCADALSRRRVVDSDDTSPFFVEPGQLYKTAASVHKVHSWQPPVHKDTAINASSRWSVSLKQTPAHQFYLKVTDTAHSAATNVDPAAVCGESAGYKSQQVETASMARYRATWPKLYGSC